MSYFLVFFLHNRSSGIVPAYSVTGEPEVGDVAKVRWKGRSCRAKVLFKGRKELCELKSTSVTEEGELEEDSFEVSIPNFPAASPCQDISESSSPELTIRSTTLSKLEGDVAFLKGLVLQMSSMVASIDQRQKRIEEMLEELLRRTPDRSSTNIIDYSYVSERDVTMLRELKGDNSKAFALALEKMVYQGDPAQLEIPVDKRRSMGRVVFIQQCVFKYYDVPDYLQADVWANVKEALNNRVRRLRKALRVQEEFSMSTASHKEELPDEPIHFE